jgi:uncharacterized protein
MAHEGYHEPYELLTDETRDMHRAIISLMEELEAIDWYQQRADVVKDQELREVLVHNKNEEIEHATMTLEWIRRKSQTFDQNLHTYLFSDGPITEVEEAVTGGPAEKGTIEGGGPADRGGADGSLGIGSLKP